MGGSYQKTFRRKDFTLSHGDLDRLILEGVQWLIDHGFGWAEDVEHCEEGGCMKNADPSKVSPTAKKRGLTQIGTLGSGNHFLEVQRIDKIYDSRKAKVFGLEHQGQVTVMIHCGSRGFGRQGPRPRGGLPLIEEARTETTACLLPAMPGCPLPVGGAAIRTTRAWGACQP